MPDVAIEKAEKPKKKNRGWAGVKQAPPNPMRHPYFKEVESRIEYIAEVMLRDEWHTHRTKLELAERWGVAPATIQGYSAESSRLIDGAIKERRAALAERSIARLDQIAQKKPAMPGDLGAIVTANKELLKATGYSEPDEDKQRPTTLVQVGQAVVSPLFKGLLGEPDGQETVDAVTAAEGPNKLPA